MEKKEAMKILKDFHDKSALFSVRTALDTIIPELKESEDERIRKELIEALKQLDREKCPVDTYPYLYWIDWLEKQGEHAYFCSRIQVGDQVTRNEDGVLVNLSQLNRVAKKKDEKQSKSNIGISEATKEKLEDNLNKALEKETPESWNKFLDEQGEQKPVDRVEPKFKVGDWILIDTPCRITSIDSNKNYYVQYCDSETEHLLSTKFCETYFHLWSIKDAKDGDVLACNNGWSCIFKTLVNDETYRSYCFMDSTKWFCGTGGCHTLEEEFVKAYNGKIYPATKEQRDLLFKKMKEAGYEWDVEKKELKKIKEPENFKNQVMSEITDLVEDYITKKPACGEEDETKIKSIIAFLKSPSLCTMDGNKGIIDENIKYLKSIKDRIQPKQEWSGEDEGIYQSIMDDTIQENQLDEKQIDWLRNIKYRNFARPQKQWKPSKDQMNALKWILMNVPYCKHKEEIDGLLEQLKQL